MRPNQTNFRNLNREGRWLDFHWDGLELRAGGALQLISVPRLEGGTPPDVAALPSLSAPAGIALGPGGTMYYSDPGKNRIWTIEGCDGKIVPLACLGGGGHSVLNQPRGLLVHAKREALMVADAGHGRIAVFDLATWSLSDTLGDGVLQEPWSLAADSSGDVYVVDYAARAVLKFTISGDSVPKFWQNVAASGLVTQPAAVAVWANSVVILDLAAKKIFQFDWDGNPLTQASWTGMRQPMGLAVDGTHAWIGDGVLRKVLQFDGSTFGGDAVGYQGPVAALAYDTNKGMLWIAGGAALPPVALSIGTGFGGRGALWSDRISISGPAPKWHRLHAAVSAGDSEAHVRFFVRTSNDATPPKVDLTADPPFPASDWRSIPYDVSDCFLGGAPQKYLWVAAVVLSDRVSTPAISQIRVEYNHESYLTHLPEIYREDSQCSDFLLRYLSLVESFFDEPEAAVAGLPLLFDALSAPAATLPWLATWLALDLRGDLDESGRRKAIAKAFASYALRGTALGLRQAIEQATGVQAVIEEPILNAAWWRLPAPSTVCNTGTTGQTVWVDGAGSVLGFTTGLASAAPQGAVVGTTSVLDQSHLSTNNEFGAPLFESVAYQFSVLVYRGQVECAGKLAAVQDVIQSEKPAHTLHHVCVVEPLMRVGFQSRVGIDTVIAGPPLPTRLGEVDSASTALVLAGEPSGTIGTSRVGENTWL